MFHLVLFEQFLTEASDKVTGVADGRRAFGALGSRFDFPRTNRAFLGRRADFHRRGPARDDEAQHPLVVAVLVAA